MESNAKPVRDKVFISYSRDDKKYLEELQNQLAYYVREEQVKAWDDTKIDPGSFWYQEITQALQTTKVAVFLVSATFLASDFIFYHELRPLLQAAREEGVKILSIVVSSCLFNETELGQVQALYCSSEPLDLMSRGKRQKVWAKAVKHIKNTLQMP